MNKIIFLTIFSFIFLFGHAQPNCNVFLWEGDTIKYKACELSKEFTKYYQFDLKGQAILDSCIEICPYYAWPYYEKASTYIKSGNFLEWNHNINLSYKYDPINTLPYRASCRAKYFADYKGAIADINELDSLVDYDIGYTNLGTYHLNVWKGICYKNLKQYDIAALIINDFIANNPGDIGAYDYLHLGVCYQNLGMHKEALECFENQIGQSDLAENWYYAAISCDALDRLDERNNSLIKAQEYMDRKQTLRGDFRTLDDEIFQYDLDILKEKLQFKN